MDSRALVDTPVLAELLRPEPDPGVRRWAESAPLPIHVSVLTLEEIHSALAARPHLEVAERLARFFAEDCEILPVTAEIARHAGELGGGLRGGGRPPTQADRILAATARIHQLALVTGNTRDFEGCGIPLLDPFHAAPA